MNQVVRRDKARSFSSPYLTKYVILLGLGLWLMGTSVFLASISS